MVLLCGIVIARICSEPLIIVCVCRCDSAGREDYGSKWSMSALLRHLLEQGMNVAGNTVLYHNCCYCCCCCV